ncbi:homoserine kinase [Rothia sp. ZJ932]|uniref:homoserine kinase n=1 Tax=Rothia sp. ZJ932 TaxID=2810516 RepID=UPI0019682DB5|nr:homoserine kinase [Rothia sp. ZJ932]QRZ62559.1 homoserine kinase [Rothia sp. ZJ932]
MIDGSDEAQYSPDIIPVGASVTVSVPASSANLGPGYDSLGVSLAYFDELTVTRIEQGLEFELTGEGSDEVPHDETHLVIKAMQTAWKAVGLFELPGLRLKAENKIPHSRGMGSSASAIVAGVVAANALLPQEVQLDADAVLQICSGMEGHPDNVAPSLYGNLVISYGDEEGWHSLPVAVHERIKPVVAVPDYEVPTKVARGLIPETVPHRDAAANSGRAALLTQALSSSPEFMVAATKDLLHQSYRATAMKPSAALVAVLRGHGYPAVISGAGPTVMVFARGEEERASVIATIENFAATAPASVYHDRRLTWRVLPVEIDTQGVIVTRAQ